MPFGFRGNAAKAYLEAVENALADASYAHSLDPFRATFTHEVPLPTLNVRRNQSTPYPPSTANSGGSVSDVGSSDNIVVDYDGYASFLQSIGQYDRNIRDGMYSVANDIDTMSQSSFNVPLTSKEVSIIALGVRNPLKEHFVELTEQTDTRLRTFIDSILDIG